MNRISKIAAALILVMAGTFASSVATAQDGGQWVLIDAEGSRLVRRRDTSS